LIVKSCIYPAYQEGNGTVEILKGLQMRNKILISALGTLGGSFLAKELSGNYYIIGTDIYPASYIPASSIVDTFIQVPSVLEEDSYFKNLILICKKYEVDFLIPVIDEEILLLAKNKEYLLDIGVTPMVPDLSTVLICRDKKATFEFFDREMPAISIKTFLLNEYNGTLSYPIFLKPRSGRASIGCQVIPDEETFSLIKKRTEGNQYIIQEYIHGEVLSVDFINDIKTNSFACIAKKELLRNKNGVGTVVKILHDDKIINICSNIARKLNYKGVGNIEFIVTRTGEYNVLEINPRFPAGTEFSVLAGGDLIHDSLKIHQNFDVSLKYNIKYNTIYSRHYTVFEMGKDDER
jgi:carbamoyl-phosphate synthase large subunit